MTQSASTGLPLRVLVVDDSALYRKGVREVLDSLPDVEVVGTAIHGRLAIEKIKQLRPDLITLDIEMPELDGIGVLREMNGQDWAPGALLLSSHTTRGADSTTQGLELGAFDFVLKPSGGSPQQCMETLRGDLQPRVASFRNQLRRRRDRGNVAQGAAHTAHVARQGQSTPKRRKHPRIVGIGISTGGPATLAKMVPRIPANFPLPIVLVQHMPPLFTKSLAEELDRKSQISVCEGENGMRLEPGKMIIAPGGKQMRVVQAGGDYQVVTTDDPPERNCKPAVDYLFRSIADIYRESSLGIVMTGMGDDGLLGSQTIKSRGGAVIAQDELTSIVYGMPRQVVENQVADEIMSIDALTEYLVGIASKVGAVCR